ncbi:uncharacterized protein PFL1_00401 [Pseudozyma flocculosa PF-1]|uniref:DUF202 domain-containing protein n=1 Tax=Pseudozyma flocculosa TaxID=84751 RepID=A0A5C3ES01_9BASI|nr:uncharacterized protein PFL1_00401 [Pseudozyma flocculosa PF-1]EPQ32204.1 hypothetical protein PFL1_00401 [Pseudozyma flocculosa PF-1]SPO34852.1 uncharacterized protein PSFLO_00323 [Pseudozyma flocculosa]
MAVAPSAANGPAVSGDPQEQVLSREDLVDYRAVQRTFDGAYARTALGQLCYAVVILRLFQEKFFYVGLAYSLFAVGFIPIAVYRYRNAVQNEDRYIELQPAVQPESNGQGPASSQPPASTGGTETDRIAVSTALEQTIAPRRGIYVKSFVTAGSVVAVTTVVVTVFEVALLILIFLV